MCWSNEVVFKTEEACQQMLLVAGAVGAFGMSNRQPLLVCLDFLSLPYPHNCQHPLSSTVSSTLEEVFVHAEQKSVTSEISPSLKKFPQV
mmetsp:Transcript_4746/g.10011  ORF Transcript_4746/g.10011 Transcript_4746/m.10011 type:complete len:90 (-) Transcript_4746:690-959(-)